MTLHQIILFSFPGVTGENGDSVFFELTVTEKVQKARDNVSRADLSAALAALLHKAGGRWALGTLEEMR